MFLTPEARRGDWLDFTFTIESESMGRKDQVTRFAESMDFATKIMPAAFAVAQQAFAMGIPFNVQAYIAKMAKDRGIEWLDEVFFDPTFQARWAQIMMMGPSPATSQGTAEKGNPGPPKNPMAAILQNGQPGQVGAGVASPEKQDNQQAQAGANQGQSQLRAEGFG